jgi:voltage-gated potassium channel
MSDQDAHRESDPVNIHNGWLLVCLFVILIIVPLSEQVAPVRVLLCVGFTATIMLAAWALWQRRILRFPFLALAMVTVPIGWAALFVRSTPLFVAHCLLGSAFFWSSGVAVLVVSVKHRFATVDAVLGAISAYLLFGLAWAFTYWGMDMAWPESFSWPAALQTAANDKEQIGTFSQFVYYSMVTMSTLGYGDVTPVSGVARTFSWMQSVTGQFYVAVLVAWLVSALPRPEAIENEFKRPAKSSE